MSKEFFDLLVLVPLEEELQECFKVFPPLEDRSTPTELRYIVDSGVSGITMLVVQPEGMGRAAASNAITAALKEYNAGVVVCLGIAGSISSDMKLCDVCYSGSIVDVYENSKTTDEAGQIDLQFSPSHYDTPKEITASMNFVRTNPKYKMMYECWQNERAQIARSEIGMPLGRSREYEPISIPNTRNGVLACGSVSKSDAYNKKLRALDRKVLAIETESGGVFAETKSKGIAALTIRGISDYADRGKTELETQSGGAVRRVASGNAATFLKLQLANEHFVTAVSRFRSNQRGSAGDREVVSVSPAGSILSLLTELGEEVDEKLRELSPEFRLQPKGYRLPLPRIREFDFSTAVEVTSEADPVEVRDAIELHRVILITIPRSYPDQSLGWVIADDLLTSEVMGKQVLPIVVNGDLLGPPRSGFLVALKQHSLDQFASMPASQVVFIVDNIPFQSRNRLNFISSDIEAYPDARFIFLTRSEINTIRESDFLTRTSAGLYRLCEVSFNEIAYFIQKNFGMTDSEAEVVALRLKSIFNRFRLSAHPTYFAGIPRETLSALLQANRRAELIQLAVDGFLTFVVADDRADITLSRTTRSRFLRKLAIAVHLERLKLDHEQLIAFTRKFATEYDFEIDPIQFIQSFVDKGILYFDGDVIRFSLPFIECYLIALELISDDASALAYFALDNPNFDLHSFDLYAELGPSEALVSRLIEHLSRTLSDLNAAKSNEHVLLSPQLQPSTLKRPDRLRALQARLKQAVQDVRNRRQEKGEKQQLLDIADRVREKAAKRTEEESQKEKPGIASPEGSLIVAVRAWVIGSVLLGSAAEHVNAETKRHLARILVQLASVIIDFWTRIHQSVDFEEIKRELSDPELLKSLASDESSDLNELRRLVVNVADLLEFHFLALPFRRILNQLCEQARNPVLAASVDRAEIGDGVEGIIHSAWLMDIDSKRGRGTLKAAIAELPAASFLRYILASHFIARVYWSHSTPEARLTLLDAADEAIKGLALKFPKETLQRMIRKEPDRSNTS